MTGGLKGVSPSQAPEGYHEVIALQVACISPETLLKAGGGNSQGLNFLQKHHGNPAGMFL